MYYGTGRFDYSRRRSIFGGLWMIGIGSLFLLARFHVVEWYRIGDWFQDYWPVLLILVGVSHMVRAVLERR